MPSPYNNNFALFFEIKSLHNCSEQDLLRNQSSKIIHRKPFINEKLDY